VSWLQTEDDKQAPRNANNSPLTLPVIMIRKTDYRSRRLYFGAGIRNAIWGHFWVLLLPPHLHRTDYAEAGFPLSAEAFHPRNSTEKPVHPWLVKPHLMCRDVFKVSCHYAEDLIRGARKRSMRSWTLEEVVISA